MRLTDSSFYPDRLFTYIGLVSVVIFKLVNLMVVILSHKILLLLLLQVLLLVVMVIAVFIMGNSGTLI